MTRVKVKFRAFSPESKEGALYYHVYHKRVTRRIYIGSRLDICEWSDAAQDVILNPDIDAARQEYLMSLRESVSKDTAKLRRIISRLIRKDVAYTADNVVEMFQPKPRSGSFVSFARQTIAEMRRIGKARTAETYETTLRSFLRFLNGRDINFNEIDDSLVVEYECELKKFGLAPNTTSYYMRNLRAIYNRAVEKELTQQNNPFRHVYTGIEKTVKRGVPLKVLRRLRDLKLPPDSFDAFARDLFMFSFYTRGMSFVDMAFLKKTDLRNGVLVYRRHKTGQQLFIKWEKPMADIVDKYDDPDSPFLLPIIRNADGNERRQYINACHYVNKRLKKIGERLNLAMPLTSYVARHAWASIARSRNVPIAVISEAMGHDSENTTRIYLASLDTSVVDRANRAIINAL